MQINELLDLWIEGDLRTGSLSNATVDSYVRIAGRIGRHYIGSYDVETITVPILQEYVDLLSLGGIHGSRHFPGYSMDYVHMFTSVLRQGFKYAVYPLQIRESSPMELVEIKKRRSSIDIFDAIDNQTDSEHIVTPDEYEQTISYLQGHRRSAAILPIQIAYFTGVRIGEACGLCWDDINLEHRYLIVSKSVRRNNDIGIIEVGPTKSGKVRVVDFGERLYGILSKCLEDKRYMEQHSTDRCKDNYVDEIVSGNRQYYSLYCMKMVEPDATATNTDSAEYKNTCKNNYTDVINTRKLDLVCTRRNGSYILPEAVADACRVVSKNIPGMSDFHFHSLRHTYTSNLLSMGAAPKDVQELLGHADMRTTMNIYAHARREDKQKVACLLDRL